MGSYDPQSEGRESDHRAEGVWEAREPGTLCGGEEGGGDGGRAAAEVDLGVPGSASRGARGKSRPGSTLLFATRGDAVHCRFLPLLEDLDEVGDYAWGAAFLAHQFDSLGTSERQTSTSSFFPFLQVWTYLHLPVLRRGILERPGLVPIARRWDSCRDTHTLSNQLASLQDAIDSYPLLDVVWQTYLEEGDEGQPWLVQARPYFGRSRSLGLCQSAVEFPGRDWTPRPSRSFRGLHDTTDWRERAKEQIQNWERQGKQVKSSTTTEDAYLQAFALKYGAKVYKGARRQVDMAGKTASLRALLYSAMQDREIAQREAEQLRKELDRVRRVAGARASSSRVEEGSQSDLEDRLAAAVRRAEEAQAELAERERELRTATDCASQLQGQVDAATGERDRLRIWVEEAELLVVETTRELATLRVQGLSVDQTEMARLCTKVTTQQIRIDELRGLVTTLGQAAQSRSTSRTYEALEKRPEVYWKEKELVRQGREDPPMGLEAEAGHPS
ncbi:hypothetical protein Taro_039899 [Colocasia esculenta]|uniref:Aminotransferase-like plant mobile domain-containing protein n=1 Tax=Colocasia esculenta TaxID=4460 RepID=A0A843WRH1_COLES|nr:hypothetical protein [Colocasia esculenta]